MDNREFFNNLAPKWDAMCHHDEKKINKILELSQIKKGTKILDVATGTGILIKYLLEKQPAKIVGVDIAEKMIEVAESKYDDDKVEFKAIDVMEYNEEKFDFIFIYSAYPHFQDKDRLIKHLKELLNVGGRLVISHSQSKEEINRVHARSEEVKDDVLAPADVNVEIINKYLEVDQCIDNSEMYYISAVLK